MTEIANPNWLTAIGMIYTAFGIVYLGLAVIFAAGWTEGSKRLGDIAGERNAIGATLGVVLTAAGLALQALGQFYLLSLGGGAVLLLLGLIAVLAGFASLDVGVSAAGRRAIRTDDSAALPARQAISVVPLRTTDEVAAKAAAG